MFKVLPLPLPVQSSLDNSLLAGAIEWSAEVAADDLLRQGEAEMAAELANAGIVSVNIRVSFTRESQRLGCAPGRPTSRSVWHLGVWTGSEELNGTGSTPHLAVADALSQHPAPAPMRLVA